MNLRNPRNPRETKKRPVLLFFCQNLPEASTSIASALRVIRVIRVRQENLFLCSSVQHRPEVNANGVMRYLWILCILCETKKQCHRVTTQEYSHTESTENTEWQVASPLLAYIADFFYRTQISRKAALFHSQLSAMPSVRVRRHIQAIAMYVYSCNPWDSWSIINYTRMMCFFLEH